MIVIGEKLNSSIPSTFKAMKEGDEAIISLIKSQEASGAKFLDINTAMFESEELSVMERVVRLALENSECGIVLDSPRPGGHKSGVEALFGTRADTQLGYVGRADR